MRQQVPKVNFGAGEIHSDLYGRFEYRIHQAGVAVLANGVVKDAGGTTKRPPTLMMAKSVANSHFVEMRIGAGDAYLIEFMQGTARFFRNGQLVKSGGTVYTVAHPFLPADFEEMWWQRQGNILWITHPVRGLWQLRRFTDNNWSSAAFEFVTRPFDTENSDTAKKIAASAKTGAGITLTATGFTFDANMVGEHMKFRDGDQRIIAQWQPVTDYNVGDLVYNASKIYVQVGPSAATSGNDPPVHEEGRWKAHPSGSTWEFVRRNYGIAAITAVAPGGATATADVIVQLPEEFSTTHVPTYPAGGSWRWSEQSISDRKGWPDVISLHKQRLYLWKGPFFDASSQDDPTDFRTGQSPADGFRDVLGASSGEANDVVWASSGKTLLVGTSGEEYSLSGQQVSSGISSQNLNIDAATSTGSRKVKPVRDKAAVLHVNQDGTRLIEIAYNFQIDDFDSEERSLTAEHLTQQGLAQLSYQRDPRKIIWIRRGDGFLLGFTWNPKQEIWAWHQHPMPGCTILSQAIIPNHLTGRADVYFKTARRICNETRYFVEKLGDFFVKERDTDPTLKPFIDCQVTIEKCGANSVTVPHLANAMCHVVSDRGDEGLHEADKDGCITLKGDDHRDRVTVGLPRRFHLRLLPSMAEFKDGSGEARYRIIKEVKFRAIGAGDIFFGDINRPELAEKITLGRADAGQPIRIQQYLDAPDVDGDWTEEDFVDIWTDAPFPLDILAADRVIEKEDT